MRGCQGHYATDVVCVGYLPVCGLYARDFEVHDVSIKHEKMGDTGSRRIHLGFSADDPLVLSLLRRKKDVPDHGVPFSASWVYLAIVGVSEKAKSIAWNA